MLDQTTIFGIISLVNFFTCLFIGSFLLVKNPRNPINISYCAFDFCIAFYAFFYFLWQSSSDPRWGVLFFKWCIVGVVLINSAFVHFTFMILSIARKWKWQLFAAHLLNVFFCYGALFLFYSDWQIKYTYGLWPIPSLIFDIYLIWWFAQVIYCFSLIWKKGILEAVGKQRQQCQWVFASSLIGFIGGATNWFVWYGIGFPPYMNGGVAIYALILGYAVLRHQLLDIEIIIKKTLVFAGLLTMAMFIVSIVSTTTKGFIGRYISFHEDISTLISVLIALTLYKPTHLLLGSVTDRFLFQKKSEVKDILKRLSEQVITIVDMEQIGKTILSTLGDALRLESGMIFFRNKSEERYLMLEHFGMTGDELRDSIKTLLEDTSIINHFITHHSAILNLDHAEKRIGLPQNVSLWLKKSKGRVCIPLFINEERFGLMVLGKKKSDQEYTQEEMDYFPTIASQAALAIRNASLVETVVEEREAKAKAQHEAKRVHYAEMLAHEVKNAVTAADLQGRSLYEQVEPKFKLLQSKFFNQSFPSVAIKQYERMCQKLIEIGRGIQDRCKKIRIITKTAQHYLSSDQSIYEEIYIKMLWEDAVTESGVTKVMFEFKGPKDKDFYVYGNPVLLQRVFVNLIRNADDAMGSRQDKKITLTCDYREIKSYPAAYFEFRDNGPGIAKENLEKIFERGFSTKPKPKSGDLFASGSGYGLYSCRETIEQFHRGKIWAESTGGAGGCFIFWIPVQGHDADKNKQAANNASV